MPHAEVMLRMPHGCVIFFGYPNSHMPCRHAVSACRYCHYCFSMGITLAVRTLVYIKRGCAALSPLPAIVVTMPLVGILRIEWFRHRNARAAGTAGAARAWGVGAAHKEERRRGGRGGSGRSAEGEVIRAKGAVSGARSPPGGARARMRAAACARVSKTQRRYSPVAWRRYGAEEARATAVRIKGYPSYRPEPAASPASIRPCEHERQHRRRSCSLSLPCVW